MDPGPVHSGPTDEVARAAQLESVLGDLAASGSLAHVELSAQLQAMRDAQHALELARDRYAELYDNVPVSCFTLDGRGHILDSNLVGAHMLGMERRSILQKPFSAWVHNPDKPAFFSYLRATIAGKSNTRLEIRLLLPHRKPVDVMLESACSGEKTDLAPVMQMVVTNISERKRMEAQLHAVYQNIEHQVTLRTLQLSDANSALEASQVRERALLNSSPDFAWLKGADGTYLAVNKAFADFVQQAPESLIGKTDDEIWNSPTAEKYRLDDQAVEVSRLPLRVEEQLTSPDGKLILVETIKTPIVDQDRVIGTVGVARDVTEQRAAQERIHYLAHHDNLTGLPNRSLLQERFERMIAESYRNKEQFAVLFIDLDRFKAVNDCFGHRVGDLLLKEAAERISHCLREVDTVARLGGDEFLVLTSQTHQPRDAAGVAEKIRSKLAEPFALLGNDISIGSSIGISQYPVDAQDRESLIKLADTAMYYAKQRGRNNVQFFDKSEHQLQSARSTIESRLERALNLGKFTLNFQPVVNVNTEALTGCEVLLRLEFEGDFIAPTEFIPVAEASGKILSIGSWVLDAACRQNRAWQDAGFPAIPISVNVSSVQFQHADFAESVKRTLAATGLDSRCLELELTETIIMNNSDATLRCLNELKTIGVSISIDDFGTGYSSLSYLQDFPIDKLKIDQSFVRNIGGREKNMALVSAIITMAKALEIQVTAEGVETPEQLSALKTESCDFAQGFFCGAPLSATAFSSRLSQKDSRYASS